MTDEGPQVQSIQARIAALNVGHVGRAPITATPANDARSDLPSLDRRKTSNVPPTSGHTGYTRNGVGNEPNGPKRDGVLPPPTITRTGQTDTQKAKPPPPPRLPPRNRSTEASPALPPRRPSEQQLTRRDSTESMASFTSNISSISALSNGTARTSTSRTPSMSARSNGTSRTKSSRAPSMDAERPLPPVYDPSTLPPLPPKRTRADIEKRYEDIEKSRVPYRSSKSSPSVTVKEKRSPPATPALPPRRPAGKEPAGATDRQEQRLEQPPPMPARKSALSYGMNKDHGTSNGTNGGAPSHGAPPPVPLSSRPDLSKIQSTKPRHHAMTQAQPSAKSCLHCRDFSAPDTHAAKFPRQSVPSIDWLAYQLTSPFPSLTDKARAIFTWLHQNVAYDTVAFFNGAVKPSTPASTLSTGLAVCEGYAALFTAIAAKAGLESVVIGGHGKGYGFSALAPNAPIPCESQGHAWNAVKIDNGEWKLIDPCWGAGTVSGKGQPYNKSFNPTFFTMSNTEFGNRHFPQNKSHFFRQDGTPNPSWEEYIVGESRHEPTLKTFPGVSDKEGIADSSILPRQLRIPVSSNASRTIRFQFSLVCPHWRPEAHAGKPFPYVLAIHGVDGREDEHVVFETDGKVWWCDVEARRLGAPGQTLNLLGITTVNGDSARGIGVREFKGMLGRVGWGGGFLATWELVR